MNDRLSLLKKVCIYSKEVLIFVPSIIISLRRSSFIALHLSVDFGKEKVVNTKLKTIRIG